MIVDGETLIFDLDGTLVNSAAFEDDCYVAAMREILGDVPIDTDWSRFEHVTDAGILKQLMEELQIPDSDRVIARVREAFGRRVRDYFSAGGACPAIAGARETLVRLAENGHRIGIATGGWRHTAGMKLERAGIEAERLVLSSCDDAVDRIGIMTDCLAKLGGNPERVVYFGDGPWDMKATASLGWRFVGIGPRLSGRCNSWIADFMDPTWPLSPKFTTVGV